MARPRSGAGPVSSLDEVVRTCVRMLEEAVRAEVAARLDAAVADARRREDTDDRAATAKPRRMCPVPGCGLPGAGPRYHWRCRDHGSVTKAALEMLTAPRVTRLPPGRDPEAPRRPGPPMECRVLGCATRSRGPHYEFFCRDHYAALSKDARRAATESWRQAREAGPAAPRAAPEPSVRIRRAGVELPAAERGPSTAGPGGAAPDEAPTPTAEGGTGREE